MFYSRTNQGLAYKLSVNNHRILLILMLSKVEFFYINKSKNNAVFETDWSTQFTFYTYRPVYRSGFLLFQSDNGFLINIIFKKKTHLFTVNVGRYPGSCIVYIMLFSYFL
uniref:Uncharacterized protein n=1 Tax=Cacopsylla melanoneura TaxID=428564 RepID=A0A8D8URJ0_9HEMI